MEATPSTAATNINNNTTTTKSYNIIANTPRRRILSSWPTTQLPCPHIGRGPLVSRVGKKRRKLTRSLDSKQQKSQRSEESQQSLRKPPPTWRNSVYAKYALDLSTQVPSLINKCMVFCFSFKTILPLRKLLMKKTPHLHSWICMKERSPRNTTHAYI